jgi:hypothetical protein
MDAAFLLLFTLRGTPCLTWGTEAVVLGDEEPANRADLPWSETDRRSPLIGQLAALRSQHGALREGSSQIVAAGPGFVRIERNLAHEVAIIDVISPDFEPSKLPDLPTQMDVASVWWAQSVESLPGASGVVQQDLEAPVVIGGGSPSRAELDGIGAWTVRVMLGQRSRAMADSQLDRDASTHTLEVTVTGAPTTRGLALVGSAPALGAWDPARAVTPIEPGSSVFRIQMRDRDVPVFKAIVVSDAGSVDWSPAPDRVVFLRPDLDTSRVALDWSPPVVPGDP